MTTPDMLDERYGRGRSPWRRGAAIAGMSIAVIAVVLFGWMIVSNSLDAVNADTTGFEVVDAHSVEVTFQVSAPVGRAIACAVEAQDEEHGVVGWRVIELPASEAPVRAVREHLPTVALATTGLVDSCWVLPEPAH